jgi:hypothetical protein
MTVKELIAELQKCDPDAEIVAFNPSLQELWDGVEVTATSFDGRPAVAITS